MKRAYASALLLVALQVLPVAAQQFTASVSLPATEVVRNPVLREAPALSLQVTSEATKSVMDRLMGSDLARLQEIAKRPEEWPDEFSGLCPAVTSHAREFAGAYASYAQGIRESLAQAGLATNWEARTGDKSMAAAEQFYREKYLAGGGARHPRFEEALIAKALLVHKSPKLTSYHAPVEAQIDSANHEALAILEEVRTKDERIAQTRDALRERILAEMQRETSREKYVALSPSAAGCLLAVKPDIRFPYEAKVAKLQGVVQVHAQVDADGVVRGVRLEEGHPALALAALDGVRRFRYFPYKQNGQPMAFETTVYVYFKGPSRK